MIRHRLALIAGVAAALATLPAAASAVAVHGSYTTIDVPGAAATFAGTVNDLGVVVGSYSDRGGSDHGFIDRRGAFTKVDVPRATGTNVNGINDLGVAVGSYTDSRGA